MRGFQAIVAAATAACLAGPVAAQVVPRSAPPAGSVIARKSGEEIRFIEVQSWQTVDVSQDLVAGDVLRTNATGQLAVLFSDRTQMRLGRNTTLLVKQIGAAADSRFALQAGSIWGRAQRGGAGLTVETAAAAAAIRGTDWSLTVDANGRTSLIVLEGLVELSNEFGSVSVAEGEGAVASIGSAPTKVIIVDPDDREQMLYYLSLRGSFNFLPASPLASPAMRAERARIAAIPAARRSAEDWVSLAEVALSYDGRQAALDAMTEARRRPLSRSQRARLDFIDALIAGSQQRYEDAARLFRAAEPGLDPRRRAIASYAGYFARALADPARIEKPPSRVADSPYAALAEAYAAGFLQDTKAAIEVLRRAEERFPNDPTLPAARAQFALLIDDREQVKEAVERALSIDPDDPTALEARANYRAGIEGDLEGAFDDLTRAVEIAPGSTSIWNALGLVQSARGAEREAEAALIRSIELDPEDPVSRANLAVFYLDQDRVAEAKEQIDIAVANDPSFDLALVARGRYHLQTGQMDKALKDLLAGSTANPAYSQGLLLLAAGFYETGDLDAAAQALENADRLDPNDPVVSSFRTAIAIDGYDAEAAIDSAQEALRRSRARGGDYAPLSANRDTGSLLNEAFGLQGLDAWGRFYGDAVFDPFSGAAFVDQSASGSADPFVNDLTFGGSPVEPSRNVFGFSSFFQGLLLDPMMISGRSRSANLFRRPFVEGALAGGFVNEADEWGWSGEGEVQAFTAYPFPVSVYARLDGLESNGLRPLAGDVGNLDIEAHSITGLGYLAAKPTPYDRVVAFVDSGRRKLSLGALANPAIFPPGVTGASLTDASDVLSTTAGLAWSHTFGYRNVGNAAVFVSLTEGESLRERLFDTAFGPFGATAEDLQDQRSVIAAAGHSYGAGDAVIRYGVEGGSIRVREETTLTVFVPLLGGFPVTAATDAEFSVARGYLDVIYEATPAFSLEGGLFGTIVEGGALDIERIEPRAGAAYAPAEGHWLRAGYIRETSLTEFGTLAPVGILGLQPNQAPLDLGGYSDTFAARWDAEWTDRLFTSVDYQHQRLHDLAIAFPASLATIDLEEGRIDRVSGTANVRLGYGFGAFATVAYADSENRDEGSPGFGGPLPFVPELSGRLGLTWVHPSNISLTVAGTYIGDRAGDEAGAELDGYWTADAFLTWEPLDKRFALELAAYNIFDRDFEVAAGAAGGPATPGWGRSFVGSLKVRF